MFESSKRTSFEKLIKRKQENVMDASDWSRIGGVYMRQHIFEKAVEAYRCAINCSESEDDRSIQYQNLGAALLKLRKDEEALEWLNRAKNAGVCHPTLIANLAVALQRTGKQDEAGALLREGRHRWPKDLAIGHNYASFLLRIGQQKEAGKLLQMLLAQAPDDLDVLLSMAKWSEDKGDEESARKHVATALKIYPNEPKAIWADAKMAMERGEYHLAWNRIENIPDTILPPDIRAGVPLLRMCLQLDSSYSDEIAMKRQFDSFAARLGDLEFAWEQPNGHEWLAVGLSQPFHLAYHEISVAPLLARYGRVCANAMSARFGETLTERPACSKIRVGIVSGHFHRHSVWDVITSGIVRHLDRSRFELFAYASDYTPDEVSENAEKNFDVFYRGPRDVENWVQQIRDDSPDILLYPEVGMKAVSSALAATRLAPIQCVAWGHPVTSGLPTLDYYLSADLLEPPDAETHYTESLVRLPGLGVALEPIAVEKSMVRLASLGIPEGRPVILCPQTPFKYTPQHDRLFARLAQKIGSCTLVFFQHSRWATAYGLLQARLEREFAVQGLNSANYCMFLPWLERDKFYGLLTHATLALDAPAFSGFTTAMQLFHHGVPMVTLEGPFMRQRLTAGILRKIGLTELVANDENAYLEIAVRLAEDHSWRMKISSELISRMQSIYGDDSAIRALENFMIHAVYEKRPSKYAPNTRNQVCVTKSTNIKNSNSPKYPWDYFDQSENNHWQNLRQDYAPVRLIDMLDIVPECSLDVGCFVGATSAFIKRRFPRCWTVGIEPMRLAAETARDRIDELHIGLLEDINLATAGNRSGQFDVIILADVLEHMYNPWGALKLLKPYLSTQGCILASIPNIRNLTVLGQLANGRWRYESTGLLDVTHIRFFTRIEVEEMFAATGYKIEVFDHNPDPRWSKLLAASNENKNLRFERLILADLTSSDTTELATLQFYVRARPV